MLHMHSIHGLFSDQKKKKNPLTGKPKIAHNFFSSKKIF